MDKRLVFTSSSELLRVPAGTVVYIAADGNYSAITTADGENFVLTMQLDRLSDASPRCSTTTTTALSASERA